MESQGEETVDVAYVHTLYKMEIERLKFITTSYIRCRLTKVRAVLLPSDCLHDQRHLLFQIEKFWIHWNSLTRDELGAIMTANEEKFLKKFTACKMDLFRESVLRHLPPAVSDFPGEDRVKRPSPASQIVCRVLRTLEDPIPIDPLYNFIVYLDSPLY